MTEKRKRKDRKSACVEQEVGVWEGALQDLRHGLSEHYRYAEPDKLRFQDRRLEWNLLERIKAPAGEDRKKRIAMINRAYRVITTCQFGYDEPVRLHTLEMKCAEQEKRFTGIGADEELCLRLESIASWIEAREAFSQWLAFKEDRDYWRGGAVKRTRRFQARILASWKTHLGVYEYEHNGRRVRGMRLWEGLGIGMNEEGTPWSPREWALILEQAARIAEEGDKDGCTPLEAWVWWCYPVFWRYRWSTREVQEAARRRFSDKDSREVIEKHDWDFRRYWMFRGLRFLGKKTNRQNPPLFEFVRDIVVPTTVRGVMVFRDFPWIPYKKKLMGL